VVGFFIGCIWRV